MSTSADWVRRRRAVVGTDLGILAMPGRALTADLQLTERAQRWIDAMRAESVTASAGLADPRPHNGAKYGAFKLS